MKNRAVRIVLFALMLLAFAAAGYELALLEGQASGLRAAARTLDAKTRQVEAAVAELRAAQYAYVASGQGAEFWPARASTLLSAIATQLPALCGLTPAVGTDGGNGAKAASGACAAALEDLGTLQRIDTSVRGYLRDDQRLLASDLVFSDLREAGQTLGLRVRGIHTRLAGSLEAAAEAVRRREIATVAGAGIFAVLVVLLLTPIGKRRDATSLDLSSTVPGQAINQPIEPAAGRPAVSPASAVSSSVAVLAGAAPAEQTSAGQDPASPAPAFIRPIDLKAAAALCTDLAQVRETTELPALLQRSAKLLDASGIVIWVDTAGGNELRPALSYGYPSQALSRIHVSKEDENATVCAYRERRLMVVEGEALSSGAIAAPLLSPGGCVGVMAAEIRRGRESDPAVQAVASIVAAQLATLVSPPAAESPSSLTVNS